MHQRELYAKLKEKSKAILENLLLADELIGLCAEIEKFFDERLGEESLLYLRYRKLKSIQGVLTRDERGYPIEGVSWIRPWVELFEQYLAEKKTEQRFTIVLALLAATIFLMLYLTWRIIASGVA